MSNTTVLKFSCYKCDAENTYPAIKDASEKGGTKVVKRCIICATENQFELPEGYTGQDDFIHRGLKE